VRRVFIVFVFVVQCAGMREKGVGKLAHITNGGEQVSFIRQQAGLFSLNPFIKLSRTTLFEFCE